MSGVASIILAFYAAYRPPTNQSAKVALWLAAAVCLLFSSYRIWLAERRRRDKAEAQLGRPLLAGFFQDIEASYIYDQEEKGRILTFSPTGTIYAIYVRIVNESPIATTLHDFSLLVECGEQRHIAEHAEEAEEPLERDKNLPVSAWALDQEKHLLNLTTLLSTGKSLTQGEGISGVLVFRFPGHIAGDNLSGGSVPLFLTLGIEDAWGVTHLIKDRWGPKPRPSQRLDPEYYINRNTNKA